MALGARGGLARPMLSSLRGQPTRPGPPPEPPATAPAAASPEMSWVSYVGLTAVAALLVGGLLWCFHRAIKASGAAAPEQVAEGDEAGR